MEISERRRQALADVFEVITTKGDPREVIDAIYARIEHPALRYSDSDYLRGAVDERDRARERIASLMLDEPSKTAGLYAAVDELQREVGRLRVIAECWAKVTPRQQAGIMREVEDEAVD